MFLPRNGINRWPQRKVASLEKAIAALESTNVGDPKRQAKIEEELESARAAKEQLVLNPNENLPIKNIKSRRQEQIQSRQVKIKERGQSSRSVVLRRPCDTQPSPKSPNNRARRGKETRE